LEAEVRIDFVRRSTSEFSESVRESGRGERERDVLRVVKSGFNQVIEAPLGPDVDDDDDSTLATFSFVEYLK